MTKKKAESARKKLSRPRVPGTPKKVKKALKAKTRKAFTEAEQELPPDLASAAVSLAVHALLSVPIDDSVEVVGQQAIAQPVDVSAFNLQASRKEARQKQTIETGNGWRCLNCMRVLSTRLSGCPYCRQRRKHSYSDHT